MMRSCARKEASAQQAREYYNSLLNFKTSLEPLQTLNLLYQCFLVRMDLLPVQFLVTKTMSVATKNRPQSQDSGRTVLYPDLCVLTNDEHWTMTPETQVCSSSLIILLCDYRKRRSTEHMQFDHYAVCTTIIT